MNAAGGPCRVALCDDAPELIMLVRAILEDEPGLEVVATATDGEQAVERCRETRPDVLLLDIAMPVLDGFAALPLVRLASPETRVIMFSAFDSPEMRERARALGAAGYVRKGVAPDELVRCVRRMCG